MTRLIDPRLIFVAIAALGLQACNQTTQSAAMPTTSVPLPTPTTAPIPAPKYKPAVSIKAPYAPPPAMVETVPPKPYGPDDGYFVWNPGHYHWSSSSTGGYVWLPGGFVERPYQGSVWTNGAWTLTDGSWGWTPGYWN